VLRALLGAVRLLSSADTRCPQATRQLPSSIATATLVTLRRPCESEVATSLVSVVSRAFSRCRPSQRSPRHHPPLAPPPPDRPPPPA
jgi:hypothetical protein